MSKLFNDKTGPLIKYSCNISKFVQDKIILLLDDKKTGKQNNDTTSIFWPPNVGFGSGSEVGSGTLTSIDQRTDTCFQMEKSSDLGGGGGGGGRG